MKVRIYYEDGHYSMSAYHEHPQLSYVEIPLEKWDEYVKHMIEESKWYKYLQELDNEQYEKDQRLQKNLGV